MYVSKGLGGGCSGLINIFIYFNLAKPHIKLQKRKLGGKETKYFNGDTAFSYEVQT